MSATAKLWEIFMAILAVLGTIYAYLEYHRSSTDPAQRKHNVRHMVRLVLILCLGMVVFIARYHRIPFLTLYSQDSFVKDNFSDNLNAWEEIEDSNDMIAKVEDSKLHIFPHREKRIELLRGRTYSNFLASFEITRELGHADDLTFGSGAVFRYVDDRDYYAFLFTAEGAYRIMKMTRGTDVGGGWRTSSLFHTNYATNRITVLASGPDFAIYVNNRLLHYERDRTEPHLLGSIGFYVTAGSNVYIDNFAIDPVDVRPDPTSPSARIVSLEGIPLSDPFLP
jgi:hypothetical protein